MDSEITAYLEEVRAHRGELGEAMRALDDALAMPLGLGQLWRRRVRAALTELAHDLEDHVSLTEAPGGLYADLRTRSPRLASGVEAQLADHVHFVTEVGRLLDARDEGTAGEDVAGHREAINQLLALLARHRQRGSDLIYEAYAVDIGGSD
ncbi:hypothetical protein [Nostocoides jenkinsii]|uniref:Hemerythrin-like domain-containing protein n=1 Tax=Nostocoides jenkinsii Ben 74 TaxID=1193518 RepID=A0A077MFK9_9MICO|nr:hypothetical protein [Tetrasphaera jenkinsii]CCI54037.1 conserved hypothetical protein [Tetrasphaera jenkinsii Ben 74]